MKSKGNVGFGLQMDIQGNEAVVLLRITSPRSLNVKKLGEVLVRFLTGGYKTLILDQGKVGKAKLKLLDFLGQLQSMMQNKRFLQCEKLIRGHYGRL
ncbi:hypothetical protein [Streptomyces sp. NBC_01500]|uniref:hypothetical protein n=1 Tax=Streptomyces sp. NBC_01500 TaxID=2903886 RepID=UPI00224F71A1|nr:hypothetical protein [Streptomyces sp. NBC_01500]MCX4554118.1 hypothetical protein [Streptomyces sp. NBC_01500]